MKSQASCLAEGRLGMASAFSPVAALVSILTPSRYLPGVVGVGVHRVSYIHLSTCRFEPGKPCCLISRHNCEAFSQPAR